MRRSWTQVGDGVRVSRSRRDSTSSTVIYAAGRALVVDPAWEPEELDGLAADVHAAGLQVLAGISTHAHHDHLLWHPQLGDVPRWASPGAAARVEANGAGLLEQLGRVPDWMTAVFGRVRPLDADAVPWSGPEAVLVVHDAHSPGHLAVWLPASRILLAGDMLSDIELPLPDDTGLIAYDRGLELLKPFVTQAAVLVPGHGSPTDRPTDRWTADRRYLDAVLSGGDPADPRRAHPEMERTHAATLAMARSAGG